MCCVFFSCRGRQARCALVTGGQTSALPIFIMPQRAVKALFEATRGRDPIITTEVGQHQRWAAQHFGFSAPNRWLTSGRLGTMGYGFPAAVGAPVARPAPPVLCL